MYITRSERHYGVGVTTTMLTWRAHDGHGFEGARVHLGAGGAFRMLGRIVRAEPDGDWTASYRLVVGDDGTVERASITSATAARERHLTINRTEDGFWLLDTGTGGSRTSFGGAIDVDLATSVAFAAIPVRRLGLHREAGEHTLSIVVVSLPDLEPKVVQQKYTTVETGASPVVTLGRENSAAGLRLDTDGIVIDYPGVAERYASAPSPA